MGPPWHESPLSSTICASSSIILGVIPSINTDYVWWGMDVGWMPPMDEANFWSSPYT